MGSSGSASHGRLLVAEDERFLLDTLGGYLESCGFEVARAATLAEAHRHLDESDVDAAILDVGLPDGNGLSLLERARPGRSVVISAAPDEARYARWGVQHSLAKPVDLAELTQLVFRLIERGEEPARRQPAAVEPSAPRDLDAVPLEAPLASLVAPPGGSLRWSWACRNLPLRGEIDVDEAAESPRAGDVVVAEVRSVGAHTRLTLSDNQRLRIYPGDRIVGVLGARYATDAFEAGVVHCEDLHLLTGAGMMGTVRTRHAGTRRPTELDYVAHLVDQRGVPVNLKELRFEPAEAAPAPAPLVLVAGTGMNTGKTTSVSLLVKGLLRRGLRVAACKVTGSVSHRDLSEIRATGAHDSRDFSDYGFPSTYLISREDLIGLFHAMLRDAGRSSPDVVVMEIADGVLQRETTMLLEDPTVRACTRGVLLAAPCSASALHGVERIRKLGHEVLAVSGVITNAPLFVRELEEHSDVTTASSRNGGAELAEVVTRHAGVGG